MPKCEMLFKLMSMNTGFAQGVSEPSGTGTGSGSGAIGCPVYVLMLDLYFKTRNVDK